MNAKEKYTANEAGAKVQWLVLDLNSYFASVEQQINPNLRGKPIAVVPVKTATTSVIAASVEAKRFGIKTGTRVSEAKTLCPKIQFIIGDHADYVRYHHQIVQAVDSCVPVHVVMSIDEMACQLTGDQEIPENAIALSKKIKLTIQNTVGSELRSSIGLAPNRFLAKVASDMQKPDGLTIILKNELPHRLYSLKLRDFPGIGYNMEKRLLNEGIATVEQLYSLEKKDLNRIWGGIHGDWFYESLRGKEISRDHTRTRSISHSHVLPPNLRSEHGAYAVAQKLLHKASSRLRKKAFWCRELAVYVRFMNGERFEKKAHLHECQDDLSLMVALRELWKQKPQQKPIKVSIWLSNLVPDAEHQFSFLENKKSHMLSLALDKIQSRYGSKKAYFAGTHEAQKAAPMRIAFTNIPEVPEIDDSQD